MADPPPNAPPLVVPLIVEGPTDRQAQPVTLGIPFPRAALAPTDPLVLSGPDGESLDLQTQQLAHWPDGSVKWLLVDFLLPAGRGDLSLHRGVPGQPRQRLLVEESARLVIDTGAAVFHLDRQLIPGIRRVFLASREHADIAGLHIMLDDGGISLMAGDAAIESSGPLRLTVRYESVRSTRALVRFVARFCFFAGTGLVRLRLTLHNPRRAQHQGGLWDLGDPGSVLFRDLSVIIRMGGVP
jgi:YetA-like protein